MSVQELAQGSFKTAHEGKSNLGHNVFLDTNFGLVTYQDVGNLYLPGMGDKQASER